MRVLVSRWQLRQPYFNGPNTYQIGPRDGDKINVKVDECGYFELNEPIDFALQVFARPVDA